MPLARSEALAVRHRLVRGGFAGAGVDALVVTHLPNVCYLTNIRSTAGIAVLTHDRVHLVIDFRYLAAVEAAWAPPHGCPGGTVIAVDRTYDATLVTLLRDGAFGRIGIEGASLPVNRHRFLSAALGAPVPLVVTDGLVERARVRKDLSEVETLRAGARLLSGLAPGLLRDVGPGRRERDVAADIDSRLRQAGFERLAFETIVASGPNAALPHARPGDRLLQAGDLVVLDFGGVHDGYCVDLTRTVSLGDPGPEARRIHEAVREAQAAAIEAVRPGVLASQVDAAARGALAARGLGEAFGHGTGHGLGVEVHEAPRIGPRRDTEPPGPAASSPADDATIEAGMVFTIEPGAYLPGWGGVRIEDDVLVTPGGCEVLTAVPRGLRVD